MGIIGNDKTYEVQSFPWLTRSFQSHKPEDNHNRIPLRKNRRGLLGISRNETCETVSRSVHPVDDRHESWPPGEGNEPGQ